MSDFVPLAATGDVPAGRSRLFVIENRKIALHHTANGFFATDNTCPHRGGPLSEGDLIGDEIICPWHFWGFDVATGQCMGQPSIRIRTHELRVDGEQIMIRLSPIEENVGTP